MDKSIRDCVLCYDAPCNRACQKFDVERMMRACKFDNVEAAASRIDFTCNSENCSAPCQTACPKNVKIKRILSEITENKKNHEKSSGHVSVDLSCDLCGIKLENPFMLSSSVVSSEYDMIARAFDQGWAGVSFKTISLMEMHEASPRFSVLKGMDGTFAGFKNIEQLSDHSLEENMECFRKLKENYPTKILVASIMGRNEEEWEYLSRKVTEAGVDVIELNFSCPNMEEKGTGSDIGQNPEEVRRFTKAARRGTDIPILAKMTPNITDMRIPARAAMEGGANGISAINTIKSITGVNIDTFVAAPAVEGKSSLGGYSGRAVKPIGLRFISDLKNDEALRGAHLSGMGGIYTWKDALEYLLLGAGSLQITTAVMEYGHRIIEDLLSGLEHYMQRKHYKSVDEFIGAAASKVVNTDELERDTILFPKFNLEKCDGCGRCYISCRDGGHQAIRFDKERRQPALTGEKCVGCHLCIHVCPNGAIGTVEKRITRK